MKNFSEYLNRPLVYQLPPLDSFDKEKIIEEIYKGYKKEKGEGQKGQEDGTSNFGGYQSSHKTKYLNGLMTTRGEDEIPTFPITLEYIRERLESSEGINFPHQIVESWANINKKGDFNAPHHHGPYGFSAILFVTDAPGLQFIDTSVNGYPQHFINRIDGRSGEMVIFPSPYLHWVLPSESEEDRITYAVNIAVGDNAYDNLYSQ